MIHSVQVKDVADQPPEFVDVPSVTRISENVEPFSEVSVIAGRPFDKTQLLIGLHIYATEHKNE